jgi:hypothetical protein
VMSYAIKLFFYNDNDNSSILQFSLVLVILGLAAHAFINFVFVTPMLLTFTLLFLAVVAREQESRLLFFPFRRIKPIIAKAVVFALMIIPTSNLVVDTLIDNLFNPSSITHTVIPLLKPTQSDHLFDIAVTTSNFRKHNIFSRHYLIQQLDFSLEQTTNSDNKNKLEKLIENEYLSYVYSCSLCSQPYIKLAEFYKKINLPNQAEKMYRAGIHVEPYNVTNQLNFANFLNDSGKGKIAIQELKVFATTWQDFISRRSNTDQIDRINQTLSNISSQQL